MRAVPMIEVLPAEIATGVQLVGIVQSKGEWCAVRALVAFQRCEGVPLRLHPDWLAAQPAGGLPSAALRDLVLEALPVHSPWRPIVSAAGRCPVCDKTAEERLLTSSGQTICEAHLGTLWEERLLRGRSDSTAPCSRCGEPAGLLWEHVNQSLCTYCLCREVLRRWPVERWIYLGGTPLAANRQGDLRIFGKAWRQTGPCERCGAERIRIRKVTLDFPKSQGPVYPLWELSPGDHSREGDRRRQRQLEAYTRGFMRITVECPHCGFMQRELPGILPA